MEVGLKEDEDGNILIVGNIIPIVVVFPKETIIYVNESLKSLYKSMFTSKGADMKVTSFQKTPTMSLVMWRLVIKGEINKKAKKDQIDFKLILGQCLLLLSTNKQLGYRSQYNDSIQKGATKQTCAFPL